MSNIQNHDIHPKTQSLRAYVWSVIFIMVVTAGVWYVVKHFKRPGQMTLIESQAMDMSAMKAPVGAVPVALETVGESDFAAYLSYSGSVVPYSEQEVYPRVEGWIKDMPVYPGDEVRKGQLLARLDSPDVRSRSAAAGADARAAGFTAASANDEVEKMRRMVDAADAELKSARANAAFREAELKRMESLFGSGAVSRSEFDQERAMAAEARAMVEGAEAELGAAKRDQNVSTLGKKSMQLMAKAGESRAAAERTVEGYLELTSLLNGVVTERMVSPGTLARPGTPILRVAEIGRVRIQANVSQGDAARVRPGYPVEIESTRNPGEKTIAEVTAVFPASDPVTRTSVVEAVVDNAEREFLPGDYVKMRIAAGGSDSALTVPERAVMRWGNNGKPFVWTAVSRGGGGKAIYTCVMHPEVRQDHPGDCPKCRMKLTPEKSDGKLTAHLVEIKIGATDGERVEILSGLETGDRVVTDGGADLKEGDSLHETEWTADGPAELPPAPGVAQEHAGHGGKVESGSSADEHAGHGGKAKESKVKIERKAKVEKKTKERRTRTGEHDAPKHGDHNKAAAPKVSPDAHDHGAHENHGAAKPAESGKAVYICTMCPDVKSDKPGRCPSCGMDLVPEKQ